MIGKLLFTTVFSFIQRWKVSTFPLSVSLLFLLMASCTKKEDPDDMATPIDVHTQWIIDANGQLVSGQADGQWQAHDFTATERNLFTSLDTADLSGTLPPLTVMELPDSYNSIYPNPFSSVFAIRLGFTSDYTGPFVMKYVIVDSLMNPLEKKVIRLEANLYPGPDNPSSAHVQFMPNIPAGQFRLYYSLSAASAPNFYQTWGNIQKN